MQPASSQVVLTSGVATRRFGSITAIRGSDWQQGPPSPTLDEYAAPWLVGMVGLVRPQTLEAYTSRLEQHVLPHLGGRRLDEITVDDILELIRTLLTTAILTGLRQGELLGLRWRDVDFDDQLIHVRRAIDRKGRNVPPKTRHSVRDVVLAPGLAEALQEHRERSPFSGADDLVFASRVGTPFNPRNLWRQAFGPALSKAGIERLRWHDMRHTFASLLI